MITPLLTSVHGSKKEYNLHELQKVSRTQPHPQKLPETEVISGVIIIDVVVLNINQPFALVYTVAWSNFYLNISVKLRVAQIMCK